MRLTKILILLVVLTSLGCAHGGTKKSPLEGQSDEITEDHPGYYEPEMHRKYYDKRYENDPAFEKYYDWKKK